MFLNICGFETGDASEVKATGGTFSVQSTTKRTGSYALRCNPSAGTGYVKFWGLAANGTPSEPSDQTIGWVFHIRFAALPSANSIVAFWQNSFGAARLNVKVDSSGNLTIVGNSTASPTVATLSVGTWYRVELYSNSGTAHCKVDGGTEQTCTYANSVIGEWGLGIDTGTATFDAYYDDVAITDAGAYPGAGQVNILKPNGAGNFAPPNGSYADCDEVPHDSDTTYTSSNVSGNVDATFALESVATGGVSGTIGTVKGVAIVRRTVGSSGMYLFAYAGSTANQTSNATIGTSYTLLAKMWDTDFGGSGAWTTGDLDGLETGWGCGAAGGSAGYCTAAYAMVWCTGQINTTVTPGAASLTTTRYSPSAKVNNIVTPGALSLTTARYTPTVLTPQAVTPGTLSAALTAYAPAATVGLAVTPGTLATALTAYTPTVVNPQSATPGTLALALTAYEPGAVLGTKVMPGALSAVLSAYAPSAILNSIVTPGALSAALTAYAPSAIINNIVTPGTLATVLTAYEPSALLNSIVTPGALTTALTAYAPAALLNNIVTPGALSASLTAYAPSAIVNFIVTPGAGSLAIATYGINIYLSGSTFGARQYWRSTQHKEYTKLVPYRDYRRVTTYKDYIKSVKWVDRA